MVMPQGREARRSGAGPRTSGFDTTSKAFSKKSNKANKYFIIFGVIVAVIIAVLLLSSLRSQAK